MSGVLRNPYWSPNKNRRGGGEAGECMFVLSCSSFVCLASAPARQAVTSEEEAEEEEEEEFHKLGQPTGLTRPSLSHF